jgi:hypothetical protein
MALNENPRGRVRRTAVILLAFVAILVVGALALNWFERTRSAEQEYAVYSAYLSEGILNDPHDWSVGPSIQVVIEDRTEARATLRWWLMYSMDGRVGFEHLQPTTRLSFAFRNLFQTRLQSKIQLPGRARAVLASMSEIEATDFQQRFPHNMGYIAISGVGFNRDQTQAVFYIDHFCGLCGGGRYVTMEKVNGSWHVREEHYTWIS